MIKEKLMILNSSESENNLKSYLLTKIRVFYFKLRLIISRFILNISNIIWLFIIQVLIFSGLLNKNIFVLVIYKLCLHFIVIM